jgi:hypothetical protein
MRFTARLAGKVNGVFSIGFADVLVHRARIQRDPVNGESASRVERGLGDVLPAVARSRKPLRALA